MGPRSTEQPSTERLSADPEKEPAVAAAAAAADRDSYANPDKAKNDADDAEPPAQDGVRRVEAITQVWSRSELLVIFVL